MKSRTWMLVSDAAKGRLYEGAGRGIRELAGFVHPACACKVAALRSDAAGRRGGGGYDRPGLTDATDPREIEAARFARQYARMLREGLDRQAFEDLVLVAPPHFLGMLRKALDPRVARRVTAAVPHDYVALAPRELGRRLGFPHNGHGGALPPRIQRRSLW